MRANIRLWMLVAVCAGVGLYAVFSHTDEGKPPRAAGTSSSGSASARGDSPPRTLKFADCTLGANEAGQLDEFPTLTSVEFRNCEIEVEIWEALAGQSELKSLRIDECQFAGSGLELLQAAGALRHLFLNRVTLDSATWAAVARLSQLRSLNLADSNVSDSDLQHIAQLSELERLYLGGTQITGAGLNAFPKAHRLQLLNLDSTELSAEGIAEISRFPELTALYLNGVPLDEDLLSTLVQTLVPTHQSLQSIHLAKTALTNDSIETLSELRSLPALSLVSLYDTEISKTAFLRLAELTPELRYQVDYPAGNE